MYTWGSGQYACIGDGAQTDRSEPTRVAGLPAVQRIAAGSFHVLAAAGEALYSWGFNKFGCAPSLAAGGRAGRRT